MPGGALARASLGLGLGMVLLAGLLWYLAPDWAAVRRSARLEPVALGGALVATGVTTWVTSLRWQCLAEALGSARLPFAVYFHHLALTRLLGQLSSTLVMDLLGRSVALRSAGGSRSLGRLMLPLLLERFVDLVLPAALVLWAVAVRDRSAEVQVAGFSATIAAIGLGCVFLLGPAARLLLAGYLGARRLVGRTSDATDAAPESPPLSLRTATRVATLGVARYLAVILQFSAMGMAVGLVLPIFTIAAATGPAQLAGLVGLTPGGLGIQEAGWAGALAWLGLEATPIALFVLATRVLTIANFAILSGLSWLMVGARPSRA